MFVGHYGVSYGGKAVNPSVPLWILFVAVQFLDVLWGVFVLIGLEKVRIVPGITATNPLDLYYMPYTHGLIGAAAWSVAAGIAYSRWRPSARGGLIVGAAVFSHWILDLVVHRPDLPLLGNRFKVGFGLWNVPAVAFLLEILLLAGGLAWYLTHTRRSAPGGTLGFAIFGGALVLLQLVVFFGAPPTSATAAAATALGSYAVLAAIAAWLEQRREPISPVGEPPPRSA